MRIVLRLFLLLAWIGCATRPPAPVHVVIVGTTDLHGWFAAREGKGGLALLASYVNALRAANPGRVLLVSSGDLFQGTLESNLFEGEPVVKAYNEMGYTAVAIGNHEFDYGPVGPDSVARVPGEDPLGALKRNVTMAKFPFLSANLTERATGQTPPWAKRDVLLNAGGAKIGIIGLSTPDTPNTTTPQNVASLNFGDPVEATISAAKELRAQGADAVVVIAHIGGRCSDMNDPDDVASCDRNQEVMQDLQRLPAGTIDAWFAGHTHAQMRQFIHGVAVLQAQPFGRAFSILDLWVDPRQHRVERSGMRPHTPVTSAMKPDAGVATIVQPYLDQVAAKRNQPIGIRTAAPFLRAYLKESSLGDLLTDSMKQATGADIAFQNSGGIRTDLRAGDLLYGDIFDVAPFDNYPAVVMMTGAQIAEALRITSTGQRGILQVSGLRYTVDWARDVSNRVSSVALQDGRPLDPNALYRVAMPDFLASGGEGLQGVMRSIPADRMKTDLSAPLREVFIVELQKFPQPLTPKLYGRITVLNDRGAAER